MTSYRQADTLLSIQQALDWQASALLPVMASDRECLAALRDLEEIHGLLVDDDVEEYPPRPVERRPGRLTLASFCATAAVFALLSFAPGAVSGGIELGAAAAVAAAVGPLSAFGAQKAGWLG